MRVDVAQEVFAARPTRGALVATLFAVVLGAAVVSFGLGSDDDEPTAIETAAPEEATTSTVAVEVAEPVAEATTTTEAPGVDPADEAAMADYDAAMAAMGPRGIDSPQQEVLSARSDEAEPASPTTAAPTTAPPTTAPPATEPTTTTSASDAPADGGDDPAATDTSDTSETTESTESTEPPAEGETTTTTEAPATTTHPDGFVDAGHGVFVPPVLLEIRFCESTDNYSAANPSSTARGAYQFLKSSWAAYGHADRYGVSEAHLASPAQQDEAALITWQRDGTRPWNASKHCWG